MEQSTNAVKESVWMRSVLNFKDCSIRPPMTISYAFSHMRGSVEEETVSPPWTTDTIRQHGENLIKSLITNEKACPRHFCHPYIQHSASRRWWTMASEFLLTSTIEIIEPTCVHTTSTQGHLIMKQAVR
jgi:hypothetical protein